jgi:uncharacterized RDD family membrane protein YckC
MTTVDRKHKQRKQTVANKQARVVLTFRAKVLPVASLAVWFLFPYAFLTLFQKSVAMRTFETKLVEILASSVHLFAKIHRLVASRALWTSAKHCS